MRITGKHIVGACALVITGIAAIGTYICYKEIRDEEDTKIREAEEKANMAFDNEDAEDAEIPERGTVPETIVKAAGRMASDVIEGIAQEPIPFLGICAFGVIASVCYTAGKNDGVNSGFIYGYANGLTKEEDLITRSCPEGFVDALNRNITDYIHKNPDEGNISIYDDEHIIEKIRDLKDEMKHWR